MVELKFPVTELDKDKFQVVVDMAIYAKESLVAACYKFTDRFYIHQHTSGNNVIATFETKDGNYISDVIGWNISFLIDNGEILDIKSQGKKRDVYKYICKNVKDWLSPPCSILPTITNQGNAFAVWMQLHS